MATNAKPDFRVRTPQNNGQKTFYHDLGAAWIKENGVISVQLFGTPINGTLIFVPVNEQVEAKEAA